MCYKCFFASFARTNFENKILALVFRFRRCSLPLKTASRAINGDINGLAGLAGFL
jgi:hypothetical protein